ncbi:DUF4382 domain-containing protein [Inhella proteolytica]|uniref:DUF4382 domain-containing protein n=1 Tax=Inhella proteolytica TaxID=2795029 RepID=A0A931J7U7_9BURK|nr:DUF4382 domain-containing protein [Inhella proteolytica]MBH9579388.1 DUF4382 domain-containing protein [Inhella proteolytica]
MPHLPAPAPAAARLALPSTTAALVAVLTLVACGGGGVSASLPTPPAPPGPGASMGSLRVYLTDAPSCGYEKVFVTVSKVRVHASSTADESATGWVDLNLPTPRRLDLLALTNGALAELGQVALPAGRYQQLRLVLEPNSSANPLANAAQPVGGGGERALDTPSGTQSGLKINLNLDVAANQVADLAIDFDACKSIVKAGNSGKLLLKPVLSALPMLGDAGLRVVGYVNPAMVGATVSVQQGGLPVRATPPDASGRFVLYPVPAGSYELVITAPGRVAAVMTGVPVVTTAHTLVGSETVRINTPVSLLSADISGTVSLAGSTANTGGAVRALQSLTAGPTVEIGYATADAVSGQYLLGALPLGAPVQTAYSPTATSFSWAGQPLDAGKLRLEASATGVATAKTQGLLLTGHTVVNFSF